jgi:predicted DNA-binding transcriptional regulator YafY
VRPNEGTDGWKPKSLEEWHRLPRHDIRRPQSYHESVIFVACETHGRIRLIYTGGSHAGQLRTVRPVRLYEVPVIGRRYFTAFCELEGGMREFRVDRVTQVVSDWVETPGDHSGRRRGAPPAESARTSSSVWRLLLAAAMITLVVRACQT